MNYDIIRKIVAFFVSTVTWLLPITSNGSTKVAEKPQAPAIRQMTDKKTQELTIMSFNVLVRGEGDLTPENRFNGVVQTIRSQTPDSFGLQEADEFWRIKLKWELNDTYAVAGNYGRQLGWHEGAPIFYNKKKFLCLAQGTFWLSDTPFIYSMGWDASVTRICSWALLRDKDSGFTYVHYNAHFDHISATARTNSAALVVERINKYKLPTVLTGDFNCYPDSTA